jgi:hypothetical protein
VPAPSSYLRWQGVLIPVWAVRLLVLALILPVLIATIDGMARVRRRGHRVARWTVWVLSACIPFALAVLAVVGLRKVGLINIAPPGPIGGDALTLGGRAVAILIALGCLIVLSSVAVWRFGRRMWSGSTAPEASGGRGRHRQGLPDDAASPGAAAALLLVLCVVTLVIWLENPFAAALMVVPLHAWMWIVAPEERVRTPWAVLLLLIGLVPGVLALLYYAMVMALGPAEAAWNAVLMLAGGSFSVVAALEWSVVLGCVVSLALMIIRMARQPRPAEVPVSVRGPISYAGPRSLGGTKSAIRR